MIRYTLRVIEQFQTNYSQYKNYPFDELDFTFRFELQSFSLADANDEMQYYKFDFYRQTNSQVEWKDKVDRLPEFDIDFE